MPIYEYHCNDCNTTFEQFVRSMTVQETITCPDCGGQHVKKAISLFGGVGGSSSAKSGGSSAASNCAPTG